MGSLSENKQEHIAAITVPINFFKIRLHNCECFTQPLIALVEDLSVHLFVSHYGN